MTLVINKSTQSEAATKACVILLHGLARSSRSMGKLAKALDNSGFIVVNQDYSSTKYPVEKLTDIAISHALAKCPKDAKIHFVTHSLGGILVRTYLRDHEIENLGNVVMLGPPNKGSQIVDKLRVLPGFKLINGPAGLQMGIDEQSLPNQLGPANFNVGIIAGTRSMNLFLSTMLPSPNDGKVSVENTKLQGMSDHIALPVTHPLMMRSDAVIVQVIHFLKYAEFM